MITGLLFTAIVVVISVVCSSHKPFGVVVLPLQSVQLSPGEPRRNSMIHD